MKEFLNKITTTKHLLLIALVALFGFNTNAQTGQADCLVDSIYNYEFTTDTSTKSLTGRTIYAYDANNNQVQKLAQDWDGDSNSWKNSYKYDGTYDANNNKTQELKQNWDGDSNSWKNSYKYDWTYDANNNQTQELRQDWDEGSNSWENASKLNWTYDASNNLTQILWQDWDVGTNTWKNHRKDEWTYDANNNQTQQFRQIWDEGANSWKNSEKYDWNYDANSNRTQELKQTWDAGSNSWKKSDKTVLTYNVNNKLTQTLWQTWDAGTNTWKDFQKSELTYDANNNKTQEHSQIIDTDDGVSWLDYIRYDYTYDANGCMLSRDYYEPWIWIDYTTHTRGEYFYTNTGNTGIATLNTREFSVYPNPANDQLTIETENELNNATATIIDLTGRVITQEKLEQPYSIINTSHLNSGVYFLQINADGKRVVKKFVKN